jgi:hypothetical protein
LIYKRLLIMKKLLVLFFAVLLSSALIFASYAEGGKEKQHITLNAIISSATDIDGDGFLDKTGTLGIKLIVSSPVGYVDLAFSEEEFNDMALTVGDDKSVRTSLGAYSVGAAISIEYYGYPELLEKLFFEASDLSEIKKCLLAACRKNGEDVRDTALTHGNEVYSTYGASAQPELSFSYNAETDGAKLFYNGTEYTVAKKFGIKNTIFITENGNAFPLSELGSKIKGLAEGEMLALFSDVDGNGLFDVMDIKRYADFSPLCTEWNAAAGVKGAALSYVLFDREVRLSAPSGRAFTAKNAEGAGLSMLITNENGGCLFSAPALCYDGQSGEYIRFGAVRNAKISSSEAKGEHIAVTFESGESVLFPSTEMLAEDMEAELFFEVRGAIGSKTVNINSAECSWFASLARIYAENGADTLAGKTATAVFSADGTAIYVNITD